MYYVQAAASAQLPEQFLLYGHDNFLANRTFVQDCLDVSMTRLDLQGLPCQLGQVMPDACQKTLVITMCLAFLALVNHSFSRLATARQ